MITDLSGIDVVFELRLCIYLNRFSSLPNLQLCYWLPGLNISTHLHVRCSGRFHVFEALTFNQTLLANLTSSILFHVETRLMEC